MSANQVSTVPSGQEVFDTVVNHLRAQGKRALNQNGICSYRTSDGLKCAFGILIRDDEYFPGMETMNASIILGNSQLFSPLVEFVLHENQLKPLRERLLSHRRLIQRLQNVHDTSDTFSWENSFEIIASCEELVYTPPVASDA